MKLLEVIYRRIMLIPAILIFTLGLTLLVLSCAFNREKLEKLLAVFGV